jgi:hypothetical protein
MDWPMTPVPTQATRVVSGVIGRSETFAAVDDDDMADAAAASGNGGRRRVREREMPASSIWGRSGCLITLTCLCR